MPRIGKSAEPRLTADLAERMAQHGCTTQIIADIFGLPYDEVVRCYGDAITRGAAKLKRWLWAKQIEAADKGNVAMLIWLGKQLLGQREHVETIVSGGATPINTLPWPELPYQIKRLLIEYCAQKHNVQMEARDVAQHELTAGEDRTDRV